MLGEKTDGKPGQVYYPAAVKTIETPKLQEGEILVKIQAAALNHRDLFIRQGLYGGIQFSSIMGADGVGQVVAPSSHPLHGKTVLIAPGAYWQSDPLGPDEGKAYGILGSQKTTFGRGTFAEYIAQRADQVVECPAHLNGSEGLASAAAFPLAGLTAYRALFTKGEVKKGHNVLITGIGGGVAIQALQYAVAAGANVWVTSGSQDKIDRAKGMGAKGGVIYKDDAWPKQLGEQLKGAQLDAVIDSGGGPIAIQVTRLLKDGGNLVHFGSTTGKSFEMNMGNVLRNHNLKGSTMGSFEEFKAATKFIDEHKIRPIVHQVFQGLEAAEEAFQTMKDGSQFGKLVVEIKQEQSSKL